MAAWASSLENSSLSNEERRQELLDKGGVVNNRSLLRPGVVRHVGQPQHFVLPIL